MNPVALYVVELRKEAVDILRETGVYRHIIKDHFFICHGIDYEASFLVMDIHDPLPGEYGGLIKVLIPLDYVACISGFEEGKTLGFEKPRTGDDKNLTDNP